LNQFGKFQIAPDLKNAQLRLFGQFVLMGHNKIAIFEPIWLKFCVMFQIAPHLKNDQWRLFCKFLVGWLVSLSKLAKIAISELIWLKFGMDVPNSRAMWAFARAFCRGRSYKMYYNFEVTDKASYRFTFGRIFSIHLLNIDLKLPRQITSHYLE